jgi:hypothetical protein
MEASAAKAAVKASTAEAAMEASAAAGAKARHGRARCNRKAEGKGRQRSGNRSKERCMHDSVSNPQVLSPEADGEMT